MNQNKFYDGPKLKRRMSIKMSIWSFEAADRKKHMGVCLKIHSQGVKMIEATFMDYVNDHETLYSNYNNNR